jgi:hypothetical protein
MKSSKSTQPVTRSQHRRAQNALSLLLEFHRRKTRIGWEVLETIWSHLQEIDTHSRTLYLEDLRGRGTESLLGYDFPLLVRTIETLITLSIAFSVALLWCVRCAMEEVAVLSVPACNPPTLGTLQKRFGQTPSVIINLVVATAGGAW